MRLPRTLYINGNKWGVRYKKLKDMVGLCEPEQRIIYIHRGISEDIKESTFLHEYIHAVLFEAGVHHTTAMDVHEIICHAVSENYCKQFKVIAKTKKDLTKV